MTQTIAKTCGLVNHAQGWRSQTATSWEKGQGSDPAGQASFLPVYIFSDTSHQSDNSRIWPAKGAILYYRPTLASFVCPWQFDIIFP